MAKYIKMGTEEWYTEVYKCASCRADTLLTDKDGYYRQPRFCANCGEMFTEEEKTMNAVSEDVKALVYKELESANERFQQFHSEHEGYAIIQEEVEELGEESDSIEMATEQLWHRIRDGIPTAQHVALVEQYAEAAACEAIQVAAMARKYLDMLEREE